MGRAHEVKVVHYLNQFFAGIGGESHADTGLHSIEGPVGPGVLLQRKLDGALADESGGHEVRISRTVVCGDNAINEMMEDTLRDAVQLVAEAGADLVIAGPAFGSGRYGLACIALCERVQADLQIPAVTAMHPANPGVASGAGTAYVVPTSERGSGMAAAMSEASRLAVQLWRGSVGSAKESGYLPRGVRRVATSDPRMSAAERAVDMVMKRLAGDSFESEIPVAAAATEVPPEPVRDLSTATIALVTEGGVVPLGNPDRIEAARAERWARYSIDGIDDLAGGRYESVHGGYDNSWVNSDPDRMLPVDALRKSERSGRIGRLYGEYFVTVGSVGAPAVMRRIGAEMAEELVAAGVEGVILPAT